MIDTAVLPSQPSTEPSPHPAAGEATRRLHPAAEADPRPLGPVALAAIVAGYTQGLARHELSELAPAPGDRQYERVLHTEACEVWVIAWGVGSRLPLHDHGASSGAFELVQGALSEVHTNLGADAGLVAGQLTAGDRRTLAPGDVHEVHNPGTEVAVSVHAYSPPLDSMQFYGLTPTAPRAERPGVNGA